MFNGLTSDLGDLTRLSNARSRSISACNFSLALFKSAMDALSLCDISFRLCANVPSSSVRPSLHLQLKSSSAILFDTSLIRRTGLVVSAGRN